MPELEHALFELGRSVELPPTPDLAAAVGSRIAELPPRSGLQRRPALVIAVAVLVVAAGAVLAVPSARTAILEWLGIKGVTIVHVDKLPAVRPAGPKLGERVTLAEARRRVTYKIVVPTLEGLGSPNEVYVAKIARERQVSFVWGSQTKIRLLMTQFPGEAIIEKMVDPSTRTEPVVIDGEPGIWFAGAAHGFVYRDPTGEARLETMRLVRRALVWQRGELTLRLEGELSKQEALRIARSAR
jgi:hypothetical protein